MSNKLPYKPLKREEEDDAPISEPTPTPAETPFAKTAEEAARIASLAGQAASSTEAPPSPRVTHKSGQMVAVRVPSDESEEIQSLREELDKLEVTSDAVDALRARIRRLRAQLGAEACNTGNWPVVRAPREDRESQP